MKKEKGFSLIELLIVVAIILIIAAIAVPNLLKSKMAANEASAAASLRTIGTGQVTYSSTYNIGFAGTLAELAPPAAPPDSSAAANLIDSTLGGVGTKSGYIFLVTGGPTGATPTAAAPNATYIATATPVSSGSSGKSTFCNDQTNVIRKDPAGGAVPVAGTGCPAAFGAPM